MKAVRLLIESELPPELRNFNREYSAGDLNSLLVEIAKSYPDAYERISSVIADHGRNASFNQGETLTLDDLRPVLNKESLFNQMRKDVAQAKATSATDEEFKAKRLKIWGDYSELIEKETQKAALAKNNNIALSVMSGARGKPAQLKAMISTPGIYADSKGNPVPLFVERSHSDGLRPFEYLASTYGARSTVTSTKNSTAKGGDFAKQMVSITAPLVVTARKSQTDNGIDLSIDDDSLKYRVLSKPAAGYPAGTLISGRVLSDLKKADLKYVMVYSPLTDSSIEGISAESLGGLNGGQLYNMGAAAGITSSQAIGEPITQMALNAKHTGGVAGKKKTFSGFETINQFVQSPEAFANKATVSELEGMVERVVPAPQGGSYVFVNGTEHYTPPGFDVLVKEGDNVEPGDALSDGIADPRDIVRLRGLGEGRKYYATRLKQILDDSGIKTDKKHTEVVARAALDHLVITDPDGMGDYLPDDTVSYNALAASYVPPKSTVKLSPEKSVGKYLQVPALHYTIGTKLTKRMAGHLADRGFKDLMVSDDEPGFAPDMTRLRTAAHTMPDWLAKMQTSYLGKNIQESAVRGEDTNVKENVHFAPRLAIGVGFGSKSEQTGKF
jgi:DNA-directed RNA polymerase subunit beta'